MSQARGFSQNGKSIYGNVTKPIFIWANWIVDSTNGNGLGIRSLKSNGYIEAVFMNTSATPGVSGTLTNPNPAAGFAVVRFKNTFNYYLGGFSGQIVPLTSTSTTSLTKGNVYVITSLGTTTLAQWQTAGLALGLLPGANGNTQPNVSSPAVGQAFVAAATASLGGTGTVGIPGVPSTVAVNVVGDPNQTQGNSNIASYAGAQVILQFSAATNSSTTTLVAAAPANGTVVAAQFNFDGSGVTIDGI